jgi:hypothetical protein
LLDADLEAEAERRAVIDESQLAFGVAQFDE